MNVFGWFIVRPQKITKELYSELLRVYPPGRRWTLPGLDGNRGEYFECELPEGDPILIQLINLLQKHGYELWRGRSAKQPNHVRFEYRRKYDKADFETVMLLQPQPKTYVGTVDRNPVGLLLLDPEAKFVKKGLNGLKGFDIGFTVTISLIVSTELRSKLESSLLKHLMFKPILSRHNPDYGPIPDYWELTGDYIMPPLVNPELDEGFYTPAEFHYRAADLSGAEYFDFALTKEDLLVNWPYPVVSQRFYRFCVEHKLDMTWEPVRIDPN